MFKIAGKTRGDLACRSRLFMPGVVIEFKCPRCGDCFNYDFKRRGSNTHCLDHPVMNEEFDFEVNCSKCKHKWNVPLILKVSLEEAHGSFQETAQ